MAQNGRGGSSSGAHSSRRLGGRPVGKKKASKAPVGSGGKNRRGLEGKGPTPKAEDRVYHKAYQERKNKERRDYADPRLAARRHVAKLSSDSDDLVFGRNSVLEALRVNVPAKELFIAMRLEADDRTREIIQIASNNGIHIMEADRLEMDRIAHSKAHQGVILKVSPYEYASLRTLADKADAAHNASPNDPRRIPLFVALDGVTDPHNLGAVIRSAAAFGANGIILPERRAASVTAAAWKVSAGAAAHLPVAKVVNLTKAIEALKERGYYAIGLDGGGDKTVGNTGFEKDPLVIVLGSEGKGISRLVSHNCDAIAGIPIGRDVESLNASVAAGIALYATSVARK